MSNFALFALVGVFASVALLTGSVASLVLSHTAAERRRLRAVGRTQTVSVLPEIMSLSSATPAGAWKQTARFLPRGPKEMERLQLRLMRAGVRYPGAAVIYTCAEFLGPVVVAAIMLLALPRAIAWYAAAVGALLAFFAPSLLLGRRIGQRRREIEDGLPDALDLMVVCIEAGSGIEQAIVKTAEELAIAHPVLAEELRTLNAEIRAGKPRLEAFKSLAQRTKVDDVRAMVAMLIQTDRFGTSIGQALRTHAESSRTRRRQRAEEAAQKIGVKLVFPLVLFFFPAFYVVILGPAVIQFVRQFMKN
jgi:tight adherence protein C